MRRRPASQLLVLDETLRALGSLGVMERYATEVELASVVGSAVATRAAEFDRLFRPLGRATTVRQQRAHNDRDAGRVDPIDLVQLGELFFVRDGHHRVAAAAAVGVDSISATVSRYCTVAYALGCLHPQDLASKAAERRFLERIPLPDQTTPLLWLDRPADWARLAESAHAWGYRHDIRDAHALGAAWWDQEVLPLVGVLRDAGRGTGLRDVQLYATALAARDRLGLLDWPAGFTTGEGCEH